MTESTGWRVYDLGGEFTGQYTGERYFIAGIDRKFNHWTPEHRFTMEVAKQVADWMNERENLKRLWRRQQLPSQPSR